MDFQNSREHLRVLYTSGILVRTWDEHIGPRIRECIGTYPASFPSCVSSSHTPRYPGMWQYGIPRGEKLVRRRWIPWVAQIQRWKREMPGRHMQLLTLRYPHETSKHDRQNWCVVYVFSRAMRILIDNVPVTRHNVSCSLFCITA